MPNCCATWGGGQGRGEDEDNNTRAATNSQSAIQFYARGCSVAANQHVRTCKPVSFGQRTCPVARPNSLGPPAQTCRFPSFPIVSRHFLSHLIVSQAFRLGSASIAGTSPAQSGKAGPIQANWPQRREGRQECGAPDATLNCFQVKFGRHSPW